MTKTPTITPHSPTITMLIAKLLKTSQDKELVPLGTGRLLFKLREQAQSEGKSFVGLLREARWQPLKARKMIGVYRAHEAKTLTDAALLGIGWTKLKLIGVQLDVDPKSKAWVAKARENDCRTLDRMARGKDEFSEVCTTFFQSPALRDRMNVALTRFGAVAHPVPGGGSPRLYGRDAAMNAMVDSILVPKPASAAIKKTLAKLGGAAVHA